MTTEENNTLKRELTALRTSNPSLSFQQAWKKLQSEKPWLFTDGAPGMGGNAAGVSLDSAPAILKRNASVKSLSDQLMRYAMGPYGAKSRQLVQAIQEGEELPTLLVQGTSVSIYDDPEPVEQRRGLIVRGHVRLTDGDPA